jgi:hypothetical protein
MAKRKIVIAIAGYRSLQGYSSIPFTPSETRVPHEAAGAETPRPRNDKNDSFIIKLGIWRVENIIITPNVFGRRWRKIIRKGLAPMDRAASTNSEFFRLIIWPRTTRAMVSHETRAMAIKSTKIELVPAGTRDMMMMTINMYGRPYIISTKRINKLSILPPTYPAMAPIMIPINTAVMVPTIPIPIEMRPP